MFQGFSEKTGAFLWELAFHNERPWFMEHKEQFERCLNQPFKGLAQETAERMRARYPTVDWQVHVSRIYRDARRLYGRGPFKENLWFTIHQGDPHEGGPTFWFELNGREWSYGAGWWEGRADLSAAWRAAIDADPDRFAHLVRGLDARGDYRLWGEVYKRPKGDRGEVIDPWYNRKNISVGWEQGYGGVMYTDGLPGALVEGYAALMPLYRFFCEVWNAVLTKRAGQPG